MANDLTGDFDVVAEFTIPAVNRVLAAMHSGNRFPHSWSLRVDDNPPPPGSPLGKRVVRAAVDPFGEAVTNPVLLAQAAALAPSALKGLSAPGLPTSTLDPSVVNPGLHRVAALGDYSHLKGIAQLQLSTPTMDVPDESGTNMTVRIQMMARYFPERETMFWSPTSETDFRLRGQIQITAGVDQVASQVGNIVDIALNAGNVDISFSPAWANQPLDHHHSQLNAINKVLRNSLITSFQPSNAVVPDNFQYMQFKTLPGGIAVLLKMVSIGALAGAVIGAVAGGGDPGAAAGALAAGDPNSVNDVFLGDGDDFVLAASSGFILQELDPLLNQIRAIQLHAVSTLGDYTGFIDSAKIDFQDGQILLTVEGQAKTDSDLSPLPNFTFTITQAFALALDQEGKTAKVVAPGGVRFIPHAGIYTWLIDLFKSVAEDKLGTLRDQFLNQVNPNIEKELNVDNILGGFLTNLMKPTDPSQQEISPDLAYTSVEIKPAGILLHGSLAVPDWPAVGVEFDLNPNEYNALKSWIPGGTIQEYKWDYNGAPLTTDGDEFVYPDPPHAGFIARKICLTVTGTRISASGPVTEPLPTVSGTACKWGSKIVTVGRGGTYAGASLGRPDVALAQFSASGAFEVVGHTSPWAAAGVGGSANLIVYFPDERTAGRLGFLTQALRDSERTDAVTSILAVLAPDQVAKVKPTEGIAVADDDRGWAHLLAVKDRPATAVIGLSGEVVWRREGEVNSADLATALKKHLVAGGRFTSRLLQLNVRIGQPAPNFLFEYAPGREMTLRKLAGRPVVLAFWKSSSKPSLETLRQLQKTAGKAAGRGPTVLAINDGEPPELARKIAAESGLSAIVVTDPEREISLAYGVNVWPTTIVIDAGGVVRDIRYGRFSGEQVKYASPAKTTSAQ